MRRTMALIWLLLGMTVLGGCWRQKHVISLDLAPTIGALAIDVENFRGSVEVRARPYQRTIRVIGTVTTTERWNRAKQGRVLDAVDVQADLDEQGSRAVLRVRSTSTRQGYDDHKVALRVLVPRCDGVRVVNSGGDVVIVNAGGSSEITNHQGAIEFRTAQPITDPITMTTVEGNIYYQVPEGSTARFDLQTLRGRVLYRDRVTTTSNMQSVSRKVYKGTLAGGTNDVVARTDIGDVNVWVMKDPMSLVRLNRTWKPDWRNNLFLQGSRRHTRNLPDDHPEVTGPPPGSQSHGFMDGQF